ncbi:hypothetical protein LguiA_010549 [Lonicera macranthoides]
MEGRVIGDYIMGKRIGSGSFAVVWKSRHRATGLEVAVKEIDKTRLINTSPKIADNLFKEISILSNICHPNIIRLFEAIQTEDRIFLVLEYCDGGDLAAYLNQRGKVSEAVAKHFMRQLAAGLQVLNENSLIHRDLKPQNLLLTTNEATPLLKIGDFGFARYVTPHGLADTLCGSPLYMAPEIIQSRKYDSKADLWSAGAILYQLVTGKPPFNGDSQLQLFQNILKSGELRFPKGALQELHPDCVDLCRSLLRQNPVERLSFEEFFNHKFLEVPTETNLVYSSIHGEDNKIKYRKSYASTSRGKGVDIFTPSIAGDMPTRTSLEDGTKFSEQLRVTDSMESIEKGYVLVNPHYASTDTLSSSMETSLLYNSVTRALSFPPILKNDHLNISVERQQTKELDANNSTWRAKDLQSHRARSPSSSTSTVFREVLQFNAGLFIESFSVELVVLAIWNEAINVSSTWLASSMEEGLPKYSSANESIPVKEGSDLGENVDFGRPRSVSMWAKQGFLVAFNRAENLSDHVLKTEGIKQMPDAVEIIFQTALEIGKSGGVDELMGNNGGAVSAYSKAKILLSFVLEEATTLPLTPRFILMPADRERIKEYICNFESRHSCFGK